MTDEARVADLRKRLADLYRPALKARAAPICSLAREWGRLPVVNLAR